VKSPQVNPSPSLTISFFRALTLSLSLSLILGCGANDPPKGPTGNRPPSIRSAKITPTPIVLSGDVRLEIQGEDPDQNALTFRCRWFINERPVVGQTDTTLDRRLLTQGMRVQAEVVAFDGYAESPPYRTDVVVVANTPPEILSLAADLVPPQVGGRIHLRIESTDADNDLIHYTYHWWRNTALVAEGEQAELDTAGFARGDQIVVEVTPHDRSGPGKPFRTELALGNSPPSISSSPPTQILQGRYQYAVTAADPDGDPLSYSLEKAPAGMTIDKATGRIDWEVSPGMTGSHRVKVMVEDTHNGFGFQEFELNIPGQS
jgi:hypothetical protein